MSFSVSASGNADSIREQVSHWPQQIADADDGSSYLTSEAKQGHAAQIDVGVKAVEVVLAVFPDRTLSVQCHGHADQIGAGQVTVVYSLLSVTDVT